MATDQDLRAFIEESCRDQGISPYIDDPADARKVARLLDPDSARHPPAPVVAAPVAEDPGATSFPKEGRPQRSRGADDSSGEAADALPLMLTVPEAARVLRIGRDLTYTLAAQRRIPAIRLGRRLLVPRDALLRFLQENTVDEVIPR